MSSAVYSVLWLDYYHVHRPHQGIGNILLEQRDQSPPESLPEYVPLGEITCQQTLGGLLNITNVN
jgi:hypothetical protein